MPRGRNERDTCRDIVIPALAVSGWAAPQIVSEYAVRAADVVAPSWVRHLGAGSVDYVLEIVPGLPVAVIEAKREHKRAADGLGQALRYAQQLDVPVAYATNGHEIIMRDLVDGTERIVDSFATPTELWSAYLRHHNLDSDTARLLLQPFNNRRSDAAGRVTQPRWYQRVAVHRVLRAIAQGRRRALLLMATGTGKTFTAMQLVAKLRDYGRLTHPDRSYRVLYLADLDVLLKQPMSRDFLQAFGAEPLHRVKGGRNTSREIYFASYQALSAMGESGDQSALFADYPQDFFDLVIIDEAHRGSAAADSSWRAVLDHFASAVQLGLTATPKRDSQIDTYAYFGEPVFEYSLRQGIEDGYLAPYRVRRVVLSPDADGWQPDPGQLDRFGREIPTGLYGTRDFERVVSLVERTHLAARHLSRLLRSGPYAKAMVFCVDVAHAEEMRAALVAQNPDLVAQDPEWAVRIVGVEPDRARLLEQFQDPESDSPTVATTSRMLSTGVDVEDLRYVVLFRPIGSMVEFKQIIGRGTRLYPDKGKLSFDIVDYVGATALFDDPDFDGQPLRPPTSDVIDGNGELVDGGGEVIDGGGPDDDGTDGLGDDAPGGVAEPEPPYDPGLPGDGDGSGAPRRGLFVVDDGDFHIVAEALRVPDRSSGRLRLTGYGDHVANTVRRIATTADELTQRWSRAPSRAEIQDLLSAEGISIDDLRAQSEGLSQLDELDLLVAIAWNQPARTRSERARRAREQHAAELAVLTERARAVLDELLDRYTEYGIDDIAGGDVLSTPRLADMGSPGELAREFGGVKAWHSQVDSVQEWLYSA